MSARKAPPDANTTDRTSTTTGTGGRDGLVIVNYGKSLLVRDAAGGLVRCVPRRSLGLVVCGDRVTWEPVGDGTGMVSGLAARASVLERTDGDGGSARPLAANIDRLVVVSAARPRPDAGLIDKYIIAAELVGVEPLLVINKTDLLDAGARAAVEEQAGEFARIGYRVLFTSALENTGMDDLRQALAGHTGILVGQSGVGKSSLIKRLLPDLEIAIGRLSAASGQGRHTTTATTLYDLPDGGRLIDSPGVRDFHLGHVPAERLEAGFREFRDVSGPCRFHNCRHLKEPGCAVAAAAAAGRVSPRRLESYRQLAAARRP